MGDMVGQVGTGSGPGTESAPIPVLRVLVVDDHPIVRSGLVGLISAQGDMVLVASVASGEEAVTSVRDADVDVVLMDLQLPGIDGLEATRRVLELRPAAAVVVLTSTSDRARILAAFDAGAVGYVLKDADPDELVSAIRAASRGESPMASRTARALVEERLATAPPVPAPRAVSAPTPVDEADDVPASRLTARELEVLRLLRDGLPNKTIARQLGITEATVKAHLSSAFQRLGVRDRTQAALWMQRHDA
jgi:DNA-binding NarL/FixJ family response regulator